MHGSNHLRSNSYCYILQRLSLGEDLTKFALRNKADIAVRKNMPPSAVSRLMEARLLEIDEVSMSAEQAE